MQEILDLEEKSIPNDRFMVQYVPVDDAFYDELVHMSGQDQSDRITSLVRISSLAPPLSFSPLSLLSCFLFVNNPKLNALLTLFGSCILTSYWTFF